MNAKTIPAERLDELDAERFRDMLASPSFSLVLARINAELERTRDACAKETELPALYRAQGAVTAWRAILTIPQTILTEIRAKKRT